MDRERGGKRREGKWRRVKKNTERKLVLLRFVKVNEQTYRGRVSRRRNGVIE